MSVEQAGVENLDPLAGDFVAVGAAVVGHLARDESEVECVEQEDQVLDRLVVLQVRPLIEVSEAQPEPENRQQ